MAKSRALEDTLAELHRLRDDPTSASAAGTLRRVLAGKLSHAIAKAAQIIGEFEMAQLTPELVAAFDRLMINPVKTDPTCSAKTQIAEALYRMGADAEATFLRGVRHVQLEPVWGGKADTAAALRGACALGLVRISAADAMVELADLLADPAPTARIAAARAIAYSENQHGVPLLRLKVRSGDDDPTVIAECLSALLHLVPASSVSFVASLLDAPEPAMRETAALALGGSRLPEALAVLRTWWDRAPEPDLRRTALLAIAMLKRDEAIEFLLSLVGEAPGPAARDAIAALALYRHDDSISRRVREIVERRDDVDLRAALATAF